MKYGFPLKKKEPINKKSNHNQLKERGFGVGRDKDKAIISYIAFFIKQLYVLITHHLHYLIPPLFFLNKNKKCIVETPTLVVIDTNKHDFIFFLFGTIHNGVAPYHEQCTFTPIYNDAWHALRVFANRKKKNHIIGLRYWGYGHVNAKRQSPQYLWTVIDY